MGFNIARSEFKVVCEVEGGGKCYVIDFYVFVENAKCYRITYGFFRTYSEALQFAEREKSKIMKKYGTGDVTYSIASFYKL